jgi:hypothetical protein
MRCSNPAVRSAAGPTPGAGGFDSEIDPFDPNTWTEPEHEHHIYGLDDASLWAVVDEVDYHYLIQWRWTPLPSGEMRNRIYLHRKTSIGPRDARIRTTVYLHIEVMKRTGVRPPSPRHCLVDHRDGDEFNCRRPNLRWVTPSQNQINKFGRHPHDFEDFSH